MAHASLGKNFEGMYICDILWLYRELKRQEYILQVLCLPYELGDRNILILFLLQVKCLIGASRLQKQCYITASV